MQYFMCIYTHIYAHIYTYVYTHVYTHVYTLNEARSGSLVTLTEHEDAEYSEEHNDDDEMMLTLPSVA
jgi:hypothetical protein